MLREALHHHSRKHLELLSHHLDLATLRLGLENLLHHTVLQWGEVGLNVLEVVANVGSDQEIRRTTETARNGKCQWHATCGFRSDKNIKKLSGMTPVGIHVIERGFLGGGD